MIVQFASALAVSLLSALATAAGTSKTEHSDRSNQRHSARRLSRCCFCTENSSARDRDSRTMFDARLASANARAALYE